MWQRVAEDYAPFEIDVTTQYPGSEDFLVRSSLSDDHYGIRVLISPVGSVINPNVGGVSYVGLFSEVGASPPAPALVRECNRATPTPQHRRRASLSRHPDPRRPRADGGIGGGGGGGGTAAAGGFHNLVFAFSDALRNDPKYIGDVASHESGHTFGLHHDGTLDSAYFLGQPTPTGGWAPIMGVGEALSLPRSS